MPLGFFLPMIARENPAPTLGFFLGMIGRKDPASTLGFFPV
jgi:hypothetical protein